MKLYKRFILLILVCAIVYLLAYFQKPKVECLKNKFNDYALVIYFPQPFYKNKALYSQMYDKVFGRVLFCGPEADSRSGRFKADLEFQSLPSYENNPHFGYQCVKLAMEKYLNFKGYFFATDDILINWWNFKNLDFKKPWYIKRIEKNPGESLPDPKDIQEKKKICQKYEEALQRFAKVKQPKQFGGKEILQMYTKNSEYACQEMNWNFFYIPHEFTSPFSFLSQATFLNAIPGNLAINSIMFSLCELHNLQPINASYVSTNGMKLDHVFWYTYFGKSKISLLHPLKVNVKDKDIMKYNIEKVKDLFLPIVELYTNC